MKSILIVDDEEAICEVLRECLTKLHYDAASVVTAEEARAALRTRNWDLVTLDVALADEDGLELASFIRTQSPSTKILMLTGMGFDPELRAEATRRGVSACLDKTLTMQQFAQAVREVLGEVAPAGPR